MKLKASWHISCFSKHVKTAESLSHSDENPGGLDTKALPQLDAVSSLALIIEAWGYESIDPKIPSTMTS
jgi:hypothetical protein